MIKVLELFGGIGSPRKALQNLELEKYNIIPDHLKKLKRWHPQRKLELKTILENYEYKTFKVVDYVEIDKYAVASYNAIYNENYNPQDVTQWDKDIDVDLIFHGSPCQDFSLAGKQAGGDKDSGTRSSLLYETVRIVKKLKPKYVIWENVKNVVSQKHRHNFDNYIEEMNQLGYKSFYQILNAKDYSIPQNRERVFTVSILGEWEDNGIGQVEYEVDQFEFPKKQELILKLKDMLEDDVEEKYYLSDDKISKIINWKAYQKPFEKVYGKNSICPTLTARGAGEDHSGMIIYCEQLDETTNLENYYQVKEATKKGYSEAVEGDSINLEQPNSQTRRGRVGKQVAQTLTTSCNQAVVKDYKIRKLTPKECWRLMGFNDNDYEKAKDIGTSNAQLYKQAGNSIVVDVLIHIFDKLLNKTSISDYDLTNTCIENINELESKIEVNSLINYKEILQKVRETVFAIMHYTNEIKADEFLKYLDELENSTDKEDN